MLQRIRNGRRFCPEAGWDDATGDLFVRDGKFVSAPADLQSVDESIDASGMVVMAGGVDLHTHIGGGKLNIARMLLPEFLSQQRSAITPDAAAISPFVPDSFATAVRYLRMGYTSCFEPAVLPTNARAAHAEMADIPGIDCGGYCLLGNEPALLQMLADDVPQAVLNDYVAAMLIATKCIAVKVVNAGGVDAFRFHRKPLDVDQPHPKYGVTPATVIRRLATAVHEIGLP
ncbi:MAG: amidohydrolase family protein, partial [Planctomycetota bacterium]